MKKNKLNKRNKKMKILFEGMQENVLSKLQSDPKYIEADNALINALNILKKDMPGEKIKQLIKFDDAATTIQGFLLEACYKQGYEDAYN